MTMQLSIKCTKCGERWRVSYPVFDPDPDSEAELKKFRDSFVCPKCKGMW